MFSFSRKPTSNNIVYKAPYLAFSMDSLSAVANHDKLLLNNNGTLDWLGTNTANGLCKLDGSGQISSAQLPSYVDEILEYATFSAFPITGEAGKIYVDKSTVNKIYRWTGSMYLLITDLSAYYNKGEIDNFTVKRNIANDCTNGSLSNLLSLSIAGVASFTTTQINTSIDFNMGWKNVNFLTQINDKLKLDELVTKSLTDLNMNTKNITGVNDLNGTSTTTSKIRTSNLHAIDDTHLAVVGNTGIEYKDGKQIRLGHGSLTREANAGTIAYGGIFPDSLSIIGKSPSTVWSNDRKIMLCDNVFISHKLTSPKIDITDAYGINGKMKFGAGVDMLSRLYMNGNNITECGIIVSDNVYTDKIWNKAGTQEKIDLTTSAKTIMKSELDLNGNNLIGVNDLKADFIYSRASENKMNLNTAGQINALVNLNMGNKALDNALRLNVDRIYNKAGTLERIDLTDNTKIMVRGEIDMVGSSISNANTVSTDFLYSRTGQAKLNFNTFNKIIALDNLDMATFDITTSTINAKPVANVLYTSVTFTHTGAAGTVLFDYTNPANTVILSTLWLVNVVKHTGSEIVNGYYCSADLNVNTNDTVRLHLTFRYL